MFKGSDLRKGYHRVSGTKQSSQQMSIRRLTVLSVTMNTAQASGTQLAGKTYNWQLASPNVTFSECCLKAEDSKH